MTIFHFGISWAKLLNCLMWSETVPRGVPKPKDTSVLGVAFAFAFAFRYLSVSFASLWSTNL